MSEFTKRFDPIEVDEVGAAEMHVVREAFKDLCLLIEGRTEPGRAQSVAITELESAARATMRAIAEAYAA